MRHKKIALSCIYLPIQSIVLYDKAYNRDGALKMTLGHFYVTFWNTEQRFISWYCTNLYQITRECSL